MIFISSRADRYLLEPLVKQLGDSVLEWSMIKGNEGEALNRIFSTGNPQYLIVLGDRLETLLTTLVAYNHDIPIIHIQGGESTFCSKDDVYRDCITRMASLHFPPHEGAAQRIFQIKPGATVVTCGAIGAELANDMEPIPREKLDFHFGERTWLVTFHPQPGEDVKELIDALKEEGGEVIWTYPNKDPGWETVLAKIEAAGFQAHVELSMSVYLSLMHYVTAVVGNSSSGLIEAPSVGAQTINVGSRQKGRAETNTVTTVPCKKNAIAGALSLSRYIPLYLRENPYYRKGTVETIVREIKERYG